MIKLARNLLRSEKELTVKAPWGKLAGLTWGDPANPPVLLCPGRMDSCASFRPLIKQLPENFYYVSVDLPGNGRSDRYPDNVRLLGVDFLPAVVALMEHLKWEKFDYIGHSLGAFLGKYYNVVYPGAISRLVELDPAPVYLPEQSDFVSWYRSYEVDFYGSSLHRKLNAPADTAPLYTYQQAVERFMQARGLSEENAANTLERSLEPVGNNLYRLTIDQRVKKIHPLPFSYSSLHALFTKPSTPTIAILSSDSVDQGAYEKYPFALNDAAWPNKNYKHFIVDSNHDLHMNKTDDVCDIINKFLKVE